MGLAILRDGKILLYKRMKAPEAGFWNIVGGKVDHLEPAEQAARREAEEESGLSIGAITYVGVTEQIISADGQHWVSLLYKTEDVTGEPRLSNRTSSPISAGSTWTIYQNRSRPSRPQSLAFFADREGFLPAPARRAAS